MLYRVHLTTLVVISTDCIGSYKSNYHARMTTMAPLFPQITYYEMKFYSMKVKIIRYFVNFTGNGLDWFHEFFML
jgi:hypothetical protein